MAPSGGCQAGAVVATVYPTLTPLLLVNSPYHGTASGSLPTHNGTYEETFYPTNGSTIGYFEHMAWTVRTGQSSPRSHSACSGGFYLHPTDHGSATIFTLSNESTINFTNDSEEPTFETTNWTAEPVFFTNGFTATTGQVSTCGTNASVRQATSTHITIGIMWQSSDAWHVLDQSVNITTHYTYSFPANGGIWQIDNLSQPGGPGGGWAFAYHPCG